jgi:hypothetical protein
MVMYVKSTRIINRRQIVKNFKNFFFFSSNFHNLIDSVNIFSLQFESTLLFMDRKVE